MKLNNLQKNFYIFFSVIISILIAALLWENINLPLNNPSGAKGLLVSKGYNPNNDTIRYIFFIFLPLITFLFLNQILKKKNLRVRELIFEKKEKVINYYPVLVVLSLIFIIFIFLEFFSVNFSFSNYDLDHFHDGVYLTPAQNYVSTKKFWLSSHLTHGASDMLYPILMWKILGVKSIGATKTLTIFLILFLKLISVLLSYQITKITNLNKDTKILFFTIFTSILISMSHYTFLGSGYYLTHRDIYIILFLIFFIELFVNSKFRSLSIISISLIATVSVLLHIDIGIYINFIFILYFLYLLITKKYNDVLLIILSFFIFWTIVVSIIGFDEFNAFLKNTKTIVFTMDLLHGLKYPTPFFSMGNTEDGTRATKLLLMQVATGLFVLNYLISNENKISKSQKILFAFLFLLSFIMYKNALGRSDAPHIKESSDLPILINSFFILNYFLIFFEKLNFLKKFSSQKFFLFCSAIFLLFYYTYNHNHYNISIIKNYKKNFINYINLEDEVFINQKQVKLIEYYKQISKGHDCIENITYEDAIPYLIKKPSCTKYWASWLASPTHMQKDYILQLKINKPKYILYYSSDRKFDGIGIYESIDLLNSYILSNYKKYEELDGYIILEKR